MSLSRRLARLEEKLNNAHSTARYVVGSYEEKHRVAALFMDMMILWNHPAEARALRADESLPPEERLTYHEALEAGLVVETDEFQAVQHASACKRARDFYQHCRRQIEERESVGDMEAAHKYAMDALQGSLGEDFVMASMFFSTHEALADEAGCPDAVWCLARAEHYASGSDSDTL